MKSTLKCGSWFLVAVLSVSYRISESQIVSLANGNFEENGGCGTTETCFSDCSGSSGCTFEAACSTGDGITAECAITGQVDSGDVYLALAFSLDQIMGDDSVTGCTFDDGTSQATIFNAWNNGKTPEEFTDSDVVLTGSEKTDGILRCVFTRVMAASADGKRFDLNETWYWFMATGALTGANALVYHGVGNRYSSSQMYSIVSPGSSTTDPTPSTSGSLVKSEECGVSEGCFSRCESETSCSWTVSWKVDSTGETATYTLRSDVGSSSGSYIALGFSADGNMGDDDVLGCAGETSGNVEEFSALTSGDNVNIYSDNDVGLVSGSLQDGILSCIIQRRVSSYSVGDKTRRDLSEQWTLLVALGSGAINQDNSVSISYHGANNRYISPRQVSVNDYVDLDATDEEHPHIKAHGAFMIGAWISLASIGIVVARYYKPVLDGDFLSQKQWFQIHRGCMVLLLVFCGLGFLMIFVEAQEWVEIKQTPKYLEGHPIMGVIVTILCVINPLMALIRPAPGTEYRPIFNWAHWFVGTAAHILGIITIFIGFELDKSDAPDSLKYILLGYVVWQVSIELVLQTMSCRCDQKVATEEKTEFANEEIELTERGSSPKSLDGNSTDKISTMKKGLFILHCCVVTAISIVLIALLGVGKKELDK